MKGYEDSRFAMSERLQMARAEIEWLSRQLKIATDALIDILKVVNEQYECNECEWKGPYSELLHFKHSPDFLVCPTCGETVTESVVQRSESISQDVRNNSMTIDQVEAGYSIPNNPPPNFPPIGGILDALQALYDEQEGPPLMRREVEWRRAYNRATDILAQRKRIDVTKSVQQEDGVPRDGP